MGIRAETIGAGQDDGGFVLRTVEDFSGPYWRFLGLFQSPGGWFLVENTCEEPEEGFWALRAFRIEGIGAQSRGDAIGNEGAAHCDNSDGGEASTNDGEKLEAGHLGHVEIGKDELRDVLAQTVKSLNTIFRNLDRITGGLKQRREGPLNQTFIID